jgi:Phage related hypothetical protein (DUF1799)
MSEEEIAEISETLTPGLHGDGIWPDNVEIVEAFLAAASQWRAVGTNVGLIFLGLDYAAARVGIELAGIAVTPELWAGVRLMEAEARYTLNSNP